jgi:hypothetical protein
MRLLKASAVGFIAAGLVGCGGPVAHSLRPLGTPGSTVVTSTAPAAAPVSLKMQARVRAAAARFYSLYSASQFAALWNLLSPDARREVSEGVWVSVHDACPGAAAGKFRIIKAVTAFGNAAIITESVAGALANPGTAEDVFSYVGGQWAYSPAEMSIYRHESIAADITAAKTAGYCTGWKVF